MPSLPDRILEHVRDPAAGGFDELAVEAFRFQFERIPPFRQLCEGRGASPATVRSWSEVPPVPSTAFASVPLAVAEGGETFRSSGTRGVRRSTHRHPFPELYRAVIDRTFAPACRPDGAELPMLALIPDREQAPESSLGFLVDHVLRHQGAPGSARAFGARGVELRSARSWIAARQRDGRPALLLTTGFALVQLLDGLARQELRFRLPPGSRLFETGGLKGEAREVPRPEMLAGVRERLGIDPGLVVREYGMTELTSHFYTDVLHGGDPDLFRPPSWTRVRVLDPASLEPLPEGRTGLICIFDLANVGSAVHVLTEDLGRLEGGGFRLEGRASGAELRGCSLMVEELSAS